MVGILAVLAVLSGCASTPSGGGLVNYHYGASLPVATTSAVVIPSQPRKVWIQTPEGTMQAWQQGRETYVVDGAGQMIPVPSSVGLDIVYTNPRDISVMRREDRSDFYALLRADQQNHNQAVNWARFRLQQDRQEHQQEIRDRQEDRRDREQAIEVIQDLSRLRERNVSLGINIIPTPEQVRVRRQTPPTVVRTSTSRSVRATPTASSSSAKPYVAQRRQAVERKPVVTPQKRQTAPRVAVERPQRNKVTASPQTRVITRPGAMAPPQTRTRGAR